MSKLGFIGTHVAAIVFTLVSMGCGSLHSDYVEQDADTYEYAQPKLEEWAKFKQDPEWEAIVKDKGIAWESRILRAKKSIAGEKASEEEN